MVTLCDNQLQYKYMSDIPSQSQSYRELREENYKTIHAAQVSNSES